MKTNERAYLALVGVSRETGWPERYSTDLFVIDAQILGIYPEHIQWEMPDGMPFGWILRDYGTFTTPADAPLNNNHADCCAREISIHDEWLTKVRRNSIAMEMYGDYASCEAKTHLYFWWDGDTLARVPGPATILDRMRAWQECHAGK